MLLLRKNKKFITVIIALIIIVLLFSVVAIVALYTSPQQNLQQVDPAAVQALIEGSNADINIQGNTFTVGEENVEGEVDEAVENEVVIPNDSDAAPTEQGEEVVIDEETTENEGEAIVVDLDASE